MKRFFLSLLITMAMTTSALSSGVTEQVANNFVKRSFDRIIDTIVENKSGKTVSISTLIKNKFVKNIIDARKITKYVFKDVDLTNYQEMVLGAYLSDKIINDYMSLINKYEEYDSLYLKVNKTKIPKAKIGHVYVTIGERDGPKADLIFKVSGLDSEPKIYDVVVHGVSLVKTYRAIMKAKYRRQGIGYIKKIVSKYAG